MGGIFKDIKTLDVATIDPKQVFAIDTNVLVWTHYSKASDPCLNKHPYQVIEYPNFVAKLLSNGNKLVTTILNITELISVVEKNEHKIYKVMNSCRDLNLKEYRKISSERLNYRHEIETMIMEIRSSYNNQIEIVNITEKEIDDFGKNIDTMQCDIFDYCVIEYLKSIGVVNYISDDKDFLSVDGINLFSTYED